MADKPFAPTPQRLRRARRDGDIAKVTELATLLSFFGGAAALAVTIPSFGSDVQGLFMLALRTARTPDHARALGSDLLPYVRAICGTLVATLAVGGGIACAVSLAATRGAITPLGIKTSRLTPWPGLKRMVNAETVTALLRATLAACAGFALLIPAIMTMVGAGLALRGVRGLAALTWERIAATTAALAGVGLVFACVEAASTQRKRLAKLRMNHDEIRREYKEQSGDPHQRGARKRRHRAVMRGGTRAVRTATVVITNPTHLAIALRYDPPAVGVPVVVARAADESASAVRDAAREAGVPLVENVALARLLYARCTEGDVIPLESYATVAVIIAALTPQRQ